MGASIGTTTGNQHKIPLGDLAEVIRSKNAGPFRITLDIFFRDVTSFRKVLGCGAITPETVAKLYNIPKEDVLFFVPVEEVFALKITIKRQATCGAFMDSDIYGAQQHAPLLSISIPESTL
jgi:hypothetical protein